MSKRGDVRLLTTARAARPIVPLELGLRVLAHDDDSRTITRPSHRGGLAIAAVRRRSRIALREQQRLFDDGRLHAGLFLGGPSSSTLREDIAAQRGHKVSSSPCSIGPCL